MMTTPKRKLNWVYHGLAWGMFMFLGVSVIWPLMEKRELTALRLLPALAIWIVMGLAYGYLTKKINEKKNK